MEKKDAGDVLVEQAVREMNPLPEFIGKRQALWDQFKERYNQELKDKTPQPIKIETFDKVCGSLLWPSLVVLFCDHLLWSSFVTLFGLPAKRESNRLQLRNRVVHLKRRKAKVGVRLRSRSPARWSPRAGPTDW